MGGSLKYFLDSISPSYGCFYKIKKEIASIKTKFQKADIIELEIFGKSLVLDGKIQSTVKDEFIYHEALVHPPMLAHPSPERVLVIGGGEGATLREVLKHRTVKEAIMVDIDEEVVNLCKGHLKEMHQGSFEDKRVTLIFDDARKFLEKEEEKNFDVIIMDSTDPLQEGPAYLLFTVEFFQTLRNRLREKGVIVIQSNSANLIETDCYSAINRTLKEVFESVVAYFTFIPAFGLDWGFNMGKKGEILDLCRIDNIDDIIKERITGELKFISKDAIKSMFHLPKHIKQIIENEKRIIRDSEPLYVI